MFFLSCSKLQINYLPTGVEVWDVKSNESRNKRTSKVPLNRWALHPARKRKMIKQQPDPAEKRKEEAGLSTKKSKLYKANKSKLN